MSKPAFVGESTSNSGLIDGNALAELAGTPVWADGPGYVAERRIGGSSQWLSGFCGDHPNNRIAELIGRIAVPSFERWLPDFLRGNARR